ncbi:MAG: hexosaminidase [Phenylobacterium sp.]
MKLIVVVFFVLLVNASAVICAEASSQPLALMPYPQSVTVNSGYLDLQKNPLVYIQGMSPNRQQHAVKRLNAKLVAKPELAFIRVMVKNQTDYQLPHHRPKLGNDESYQLDITASGISIDANSEFGALHGLETLSQLIATATIPNQLPLLSIVDQPRFAWRGLLIDSVRHFLPIATIKRQLDGMAAAKLNVFHWHLTDDQGWRFESKAYPKLHQLASDKLFYSRAQMRSVVDYASMLGIRVVAEFDVPGHASAIAVAYPQLTSQAKNYQMERHWGVFEPLLDPSNEAVYQFIDTIVQELSEIFPDAYLHIGGDEVNPSQWNNNAKIQQFMQTHQLKDSHALQAYFNARVEKILAKHQRIMMGWDEIFQTGSSKKLSKEIVIQSWRGLESLSQIAAQGYQGLLSTGFYIDQPQYTAYHYRNEPFADAVPSPQLSKNSQWQSWDLLMPRLKGSPVRGSLTLIDNPGQPRQGYLKLNNNHHKKITLINENQQQLSFELDTWMGPMRAALNLSDAKSLTGRILIGNATYQVEGAKVTSHQLPTITLLPPLTTAQQRNILGGEAALWSEMVDDNNIDVRSWPRLFAIAERFWSSKSLTDTDDMYQRLQVISRYAAEHIGLQHIQQQQAGFQQLFAEDNTDITPLLILAEALEPAHYYTRHHLKFQNNQYHQQTPLNLFVDYLPPESFTVIKMNQWLKVWQQGTLQNKQKALGLIEGKLLQWQSNMIKVRALQQQPRLASLSTVMDDVEQLITLSLAITQACQGDKSAGSQQQVSLQRIADNGKAVVVAAVPVFMRLLASCGGKD